MDRLVAAPLEERAELFVVDERARCWTRWWRTRCPGQAPARRPLAAERGTGAPMPMRYASSSFDRQWLLPDLRVVDRPNVPLWSLRDAPGQLFTSPRRPPWCRRAARPWIARRPRCRSSTTSTASGAGSGRCGSIVTAPRPSRGRHPAGPRARDRRRGVGPGPDRLHHGRGGPPRATAPASPVSCRRASSGSRSRPTARCWSAGRRLGHEVLRLQTLGEHRPPAVRHRAPDRSCLPTSAGPPSAGGAVVAPAGQPAGHRHLRPHGRHADHRRRRGHGHHPRRLGLRRRRACRSSSSGSRNG